MLRYPKVTPSDMKKLLPYLRSIHPRILERIGIDGESLHLTVYILCCIV